MLKKIIREVGWTLQRWFFLRPVAVLHDVSRNILIWTVKNNSYYVAEAYTQMSLVIAEWLQVYKEKRTGDFYIEGKSTDIENFSSDTSNWSEEVDNLLDTLILTFRRLHEGYDPPEFLEALDEWCELSKKEGSWPITDDGIDVEKLNREDSPEVAEAWRKLREIECKYDDEVKANLKLFAKYFQHLWS